MLMYLQIYSYTNVYGIVTFNSKKSMLLFQVPATSKNNKALGLRFFPQGNSPSSSLLQTNQ